MKRILGQVVSAVALAVVACASAPACVTNDQSIFIRGVLAPSTNRQNGSCSYTDDPSQPILFEGSMDLAGTDNYGAILLIGNQLIPRGDPAQTRAESNRVHINGAVVKVTYPSGEVISEFTASGSGFADPQANNVADYGTAQVTLIDAPTADRIMGQLGGSTKLVLATVKAFGQTLGGVDVESGEFQYPIRVCLGCLVRQNNPTGGPCLEVTPQSSGGGNDQAPCALGQDEYFFCNLCRPMMEGVCNGP